MKRLLLLLLVVTAAYKAGAQSGFAFNRISTGDGIGLASNVIRSIYQDDRGFIWVGTANGLQRFDGSKFIRFQTRGDDLPHASVAKVLPPAARSFSLPWTIPTNSGFSTG